MIYLAVSRIDTGYLTWVKNLPPAEFCTCFHSNSSSNGPDTWIQRALRRVTPDRRAIYVELEVYWQSGLSDTLKGMIVRYTTWDFDSKVTSSLSWAKVMHCWCGGSFKILSFLVSGIGNMPASTVLLTCLSFYFIHVCVLWPDDVGRMYHMKWQVCFLTSQAQDCVVSSLKCILHNWSLIIFITSILAKFFF